MSLDPTGSGGPSLIDRLRIETRDLHEGLERGLDWRGRMKTVDGYRGLLARWWGFHAVYEPLIEARSPLPGLRLRGKLHLLERDLGQLGMAATDIRVLPRIQSMALPDDRAGLMGAMYVLEGSTLGGQVIAKYVRLALAGTVASDANAYAYYEAYGRTRTGPMWRAFLDQLSTEAPHASHADVIAGACRTFELLRVWLTRDAPSVVTMPMSGHENFPPDATNVRF
jgi:heme oxygenase